MKKIAMALLLVLTVGIVGVSAYGGNPRSECPYCGAPAHFTGFAVTVACRVGGNMRIFCNDIL